MLNRKKLRSLFSSDLSSNRNFSFVTYIVLALVSFVMTVLNIITQKGALTICTGLFFLLCLINVALSIMSPFFAKVAKFLFAIEILCMFTFFLVTGNPDGFSAIWIAMLPSLGMFFFNRMRGTLLCAVMFSILVFLFWTSSGAQYLMYDYNATFKMRFPVLFLAFHLLAFLLETLRANAYKEMRRLQDYYHDLSGKDLLTGILNRQGMYAELDSNPKYANANRIGVAMFDVDFFKSINDKFGHSVGDLVLKEFASMLKSELDGVLCRWGGEEFVVIFTDSSLKTLDFERVREKVSTRLFYANEPFSITTSVGICDTYGVPASQIDILISKADEALYTAKTTGRNKVVNYNERYKAY